MAIPQIEGKLPRNRHWYSIKFYDFNVIQGIVVHLTQKVNQSYRKGTKGMIKYHHFSLG